MTLKSDLTDDISTFIDTDEFAETFVFSRSGLTIDAIFDEAFVLIVDDVETTQPMAQVADSDVSGITHDDTLTRVSDGVVYKVIKIQPDGTGITFVFLSRD